MSKFQILICCAVLGIFIIIIVVTQGGATTSKAVTIPTLSPDGAEFKQITPTPIGQGQQVQQQQAGVRGGPAPTYGVEEGMKASYSAILKTTKGNIELYLSGRDAPNTVKNFLTKAHAGFYKGLKFHRVEDWVVQGGDPKGDGTGGNLMQTELNSLKFVTGSLGIARGSDIRVSNDSQFFIVKSDAPHLDQQYTNFGMVVNGMDVVEKLTAGDKIIDITPIGNGSN